MSFFLGKELVLDRYERRGECDWKLKKKKKGQKARERERAKRMKRMKKNENIKTGCGLTRNESNAAIREPHVALQSGSSELSVHRSRSSKRHDGARSGRPKQGRRRSKRSEEGGHGGVIVSFGQGGLVGLRVDNMRRWKEVAVRLGCDYPEVETRFE